ARPPGPTPRSAGRASRRPPSEEPLQGAVPARCPGAHRMRTAAFPADRPRDRPRGPTAPPRGRRRSAHLTAPGRMPPHTGGMRADRLLSFLLLLQNRGRMTAAELAAELECSERTVYRDAEALGAAGIPIYADRGTGGGYRLMDGYRTRLTGLTAGEADSLFFTGLPGPADALGLGSELALVRLKLLAALPGELRERAERVGARFHLDATAWWRTPAATPHLAALARSEERRAGKE